MALLSDLIPYQPLELLQDARTYQSSFQRRKPTRRQPPASLKRNRRKVQKESQRRRSHPDNVRGVQSQSRQPGMLSSHLCRPMLQKGARRSKQGEHTSPLPQMTRNHHRDLPAPPVLQPSLHRIQGVPTTTAEQDIRLMRVTFEPPLQQPGQDLQSHRSRRL